MPIRKVKTPIQLYRDGQQVLPRVGEPFDFTDAELADLNKANPDCIEHIVTEDAAVAETATKAKKA